MNSAWRDMGERCVVTMKRSFFDPIPVYSGLGRKVLNQMLRHDIGCRHLYRSAI